MKTPVLRAVDALRAEGATVVESGGAIVIVVPREVRPDDVADLVSLADAAKVAATSVRVLRDAARAGEIALYGGQRDRSVRRADLKTWIESRRSRPVAGPLDDDIERRIARLARAREQTG